LSSLHSQRSFCAVQCGISIEHISMVIIQFGRWSMAACLAFWLISFIYAWTPFEVRSIQFIPVLTNREDQEIEIYYLLCAYRLGCFVRRVVCFLRIFLSAVNLKVYYLQDEILFFGYRISWLGWRLVIDEAFKFRLRITDGLNFYWDIIDFYWLYIIEHMNDITALQSQLSFDCSIWNPWLVLSRSDKTPKNMDAS
jgi:hypothetical protein